MDKIYELNESQFMRLLVIVVILLGIIWTTLKLVSFLIKYIQVKKWIANTDDNYRSCKFCKFCGCRFCKIYEVQIKLEKRNLNNNCTSFLGDYDKLKKAIGFDKIKYEDILDN